MHRTAIFALLALIFSRCGTDFSSDPKSLLGVWRLSDISRQSSKAGEDSDKLLQAATDKELVKEGMVFSFFPDNSFTQVLGSGGYIFGKWHWIEEGKVLCITYGGKTDTLLVEMQEGEGNLKPSVKISYPARKQDMSFVKYADLLKDYKEDPFYSANNTWRIKATVSENEDKVLERLGNYLKHITYVLKSSHERDQEVISFEFSLGIVKIYNGGIGAYDFALIPDSWKHCFFNESEALQAHKMFTNYLAASTYRGAATGNWVKDDYDIMLSIYGDLKNGKFRAPAIE